MAHQCKHGERVKRQGQGAKGMWYAAFCPTAKGSPDQCEPLWLDANGNVKGASKGAGAASPQASSEQLAILREMNNTLTMIYALMKLRPTGIGTGQGIAAPVVRTSEPPVYGTTLYNAPAPTVPTIYPPEEEIPLEDIPF